MNPRIETASRYCETCSNEIVRRQREQWHRYLRRRFCSHKCIRVRPRIIVPAQLCNQCSGVIVRAATEGAARYCLRRFCNRQCMSIYQSTHHLVRQRKHSPKSRYRNSSPEVAKRIRELYFVQRLTQKAIGELVGVAQGSVSRIVSGQVWQQ